MYLNYNYYLYLVEITITPATRKIIYLKFTAFLDHGPGSKSEHDKKNVFNHCAQQILHAL